MPNILKNFEDQSPQSLEKIGIGLTVGVEWGEALHSALMPMTPAMSLSSLSDGVCVCVCVSLSVFVCVHFGVN